jgi:hypothetical protein
MFENGQIGPLRVDPTCPNDPSHPGHRYNLDTDEIGVPFSVDWNGCGSDFLDNPFKLFQPVGLGIFIQVLFWVSPTEGFDWLGSNLKNLSYQESLVGLFSSLVFWADLAFWFIVLTMVLAYRRRTRLKRETSPPTTFMTPEELKDA